MYIYIEKHTQRLVSCLLTYLPTCILAYMHTYTYMHTYMLGNQLTRWAVHIQVYTHMHTCISVFVHAHMHMRHVSCASTPVTLF